MCLLCKVGAFRGTLSSCCYEASFVPNISTTPAQSSPRMQQQTPSRLHCGACFCRHPTTHKLIILVMRNIQQ